MPSGGIPSAHMACAPTCQRISRPLRGQHRHVAAVARSMAGQPDVALNSTVMRRQRQLEAQLAELGREGLDDRLRLASDTPLSPPHRLDQLIQDAAGKLVVVCEVRRASPAHPPKLLGELAAAYERAGADALAVRTDVEDTPTGTADIFAVVRSTQLPVLRTDYYLHPLQVVDAKESGAAGVIGAMCYGSSRGAPIVHAFAGAMGLDCPVDVVDRKEMQQMAMLGVGFFGIGLVRQPAESRQDLLGALPPGALSLVAVDSVAEAVEVHRQGAHAVLLKGLLLEQHVDVQQLVAELKSQGA